MSTIPILQHPPGFRCIFTNQWIFPGREENILLSKQHQQDASKVNKLKLHLDAAELIRRAYKMGLVITIHLAPLEPRAMGNYLPVIDIRAKVVR